MAHATERSSELRFADRAAAGRLLAAALADHAGDRDLVVLGLPRGGVPVAAQVAGALGAPLDVFVVRKLGVPGHEELGFGAVASGGVRVLDDRIVRELGLSPGIVERTTRRELDEVRRRVTAYRGERPGVEVRDRTVIVVDDGLATGSTMRAAVEGIRAQGAARVVVAVPTGSWDACAGLARHADDVVCLSTPDPFRAVGLWYDDFRAIPDEEVRAVLDRAAAGPPRTATSR
jgi:predicted phosphoribosyltransferase